MLPPISETTNDPSGPRNLDSVDGNHILIHGYLLKRGCNDQFMPSVP